MAASFVFEHALMNVFCFPFYVYPLLFVPNAAILRLFSHWNDRFRSKKDSYYIDSSKKIHFDSLYGLQKPAKPFICPDNVKIITNYFINLTPLPHDLISLVINEFCYDPQYETYVKYQYKKRKYNLFRDLFAWYLILTFIFHALSFIIILWTNIEWIMMNEYEYDIFTAIQSLCISIFAFHPLSKIFNLINISILYVEISGKKYYSCLYPFSFLVVVILIDLIAILIYIPPNLWQYMMIFVLFVYMSFGISNVNIVAVMRWFLTSFGIVQQCLIVSLLYGVMVIMSSWVSCLLYVEDWNALYGPDRPWLLNIYNNNECLLESVKSPYCPDVNLVNVNWNDWRSYIMLFSWLLF